MSHGCHPELQVIKAFAHVVAGEDSLSADEVDFFDLSRRSFCQVGEYVVGAAEGLEAVVGIFYLGGLAAVVVTVAIVVVVVTFHAVGWVAGGGCGSLNIRG